MTMLEAAKKFLKAGCNVIPVSTDTKKASVSWGRWQKEKLTDLDACSLFEDASGIAVLCGQVSGNLEVLDFDAKHYQGTDIYEEWLALLDESMPGLAAKLTLLVKTPSGGWHVPYRCLDGIGGNAKLARLPNPDFGKEKVPEFLEVIETRGDGGYVVAWPTQGYSIEKGTWGRIPSVSGEEREAMLACARKLNQGPERPHTHRAGPEHMRRPGDEFCERTTWEQVLEPHGWQKSRQTGEEAHWTRPGKKQRDGTSATTNYRGSDVLKVFSSNAHPFQPDATYTKFAAHAFLNFGGDFSAAARELSKPKFRGMDSYETTYVTHQDAGQDYDFSPIDAGSVPAMTVSYHWKPYIPKGKGVLLDGDSGTYKTSLILALFAAFSNGVDVVTGESIEPVPTLYYGKEDEPGELGTIYQANSGKKGFCKIVPQCFSLTPKAIDAVGRQIQKEGSRIVAFDSFLYFLEGVVRDINHSTQEIQRVTRDLLDVYAETGCSGIHVRHTGKSVIGKSPASLGVGSYQFRASHRGQILVRRFPDKNRRFHCYVTDEKGSLLVAQGDPFAFERVGEEVRFYVPPFDPFEPEAPVGRPDEQRQKCAAVIKANLLGGETKYAAEMLTIAETLGLNKDTFRRAAKDLGVVVAKPDSRWTWTMPDPFDTMPPHWAGLD